MLGDRWCLDWVALSVLLDKVIDLLPVGLILDEVLSVLECINEDVDLHVELGQVELHILLLGLRVLSFLITVEGVHLVLIDLVLSLSKELLQVGNIAIAAILLDKIDGLHVEILNLRVLLETDLLEVSLGVCVLLGHEPLSSLQGLSLDVVSGLREQIAKVVKLVLVDAHEDDVRQVLHGLRLGLLVALAGSWIVLQGLDHNVGLELLQDLVVTEVRELGEVEDWLLLDDLIVVVVVDLDDTLSDEVHLLDVALVADDSLSWRVKSAEHVDDELVGEASLALIEEVIEGLLKLLEHSGVLDELSLHLWGNLLVEDELLDDQVEVIHERLLDVVPDIVVQSGLNVEWLVGLLDLLDPHVEGVKLVLDEVIEVVGGIENSVDGAHQEGEESKSQELKDDREDVLLGGGTCVVSVSYGCNDLEDPIEGKYVLSVVGLVLESVGKLPTGSASVFSVVVTIIWLRVIKLAWISATEVEPDASHNMGNIDNDQNEGAEASKVILSLLGVLLEDASQKELEWLGKSHEVDQSEELQPEEVEGLVVDQIGNGGNHIKDEEAGEVVDSNGLDLLECSGPLHEVEHDLKQVDDVDGVLDLLQGPLAAIVRVSFVYFFNWVPVLVDIWEHNDEWSSKHGVNDQEGDEEVPHLAESPLGVDKVPLELWLVLIDRAVLIGILVDVIDHHFLKIRLSHFL